MATENGKKASAKSQKQQKGKTAMAKWENGHAEWQNGISIRGPHFATTFDFHLATRSSLVICEENGAQEVPGLKDHPKWLRPLQLFY